MKKKDFVPGVVVALSGRIMKTLPSVHVMEGTGRLEDLPDEERLFLCVGVRGTSVQLAEITTQGRGERLFIEYRWRGAQPGYGSLRIGRWRVGPQYLNGALFVAEADELCSAILHPQSAGRLRTVTDDGLAAVRAHLASSLGEGQSLYPWRAVPRRGTSRCWHSAA